MRRLIDYWRRLDAAATQRLEGGMSVPETARAIVLGGELAGFEDWLAPERALISVGTIDGHRRGVARAPGPRELITAFFRMALLARDLPERAKPMATN